MLASPHSTLEELYLLQKLMRGMGNGNIDSRLRTSDFAADMAESGAPWLGVAVDEINKQNAILLVGSNLRKEQPLLAARVRAAVKKGAQLSQIGVFNEDPLCKLHANQLVSPSDLVSRLAAVVAAAAAVKDVAVPEALGGIVANVDATAESIAASLIAAESALRRRKTR